MSSHTGKRRYDADTNTWVDKAPKTKQTPASNTRQKMARSAPDTPKAKPAKIKVEVSKRTVAPMPMERDKGTAARSKAAPKVDKSLVGMSSRDSVDGKPVSHKELLEFAGIKDKPKARGGKGPDIRSGGKYRS